jgi:hypothetical protein
MKGIANEFLNDFIVSVLPTSHKQSFSDILGKSNHDCIIIILDYISLQ